MKISVLILGLFFAGSPSFVLAAESTPKAVFEQLKSFAGDWQSTNNPTKNPKESATRTPTGELLCIDCLRSSLFAIRAQLVWTSPMENIPPNRSFLRNA